jgi:hypothetical protein
MILVFGRPMKKVDIVVVMFGGSIPYILLSIRKSTYYFGECYFTDFMFGEAVNMWRAGSLALEQFCFK